MLLLDIGPSVGLMMSVSGVLCFTFEQMIVCVFDVGNHYLMHHHSALIIGLTNCLHFLSDSGLDATSSVWRGSVMQ